VPDRPLFTALEDELDLAAGATRINSTMWPRDFYHVSTENRKVSRIVLSRGFDISSSLIGYVRTPGSHSVHFELVNPQSTPPCRIPDVVLDRLGCSNSCGCVHGRSRRELEAVTTVPLLVGERFDQSGDLVR